MATDIPATWRKFVSALGSLLAGSPEHPHQEQFWIVRDRALAVAATDHMAFEIKAGFDKALVGQPWFMPASAGDEQLIHPAELVLLELDCFPRAVEKYQGEVAAAKPPGSMRKSLCGAAETILGSVKDIAEVSVAAKGTLSVLKEVAKLLA
jgi:hypothetical protein